MAREVQISKSVLSVLVAALVVSLLGVAFLLGRQSAPPPEVRATPQSSPRPVAQSTPESVPPPVTINVASQSQDQSLSARLDRIEQRVDRVGVRIESTDEPPPRQDSPPKQNRRAPQAASQTSNTPPTKTLKPQQEAPPSDKNERRAYFQQVDSILKNTAAIDDPNQYATKFLQQAMSGDNSGFDSLLATTRQAKAALQKITPPPSCVEHHSLLLSQLSQSSVLLTEVHQAISTNDTTRLSAVASKGQGMQAETEKYQELDRQLRRGI
jgi:hypothetical protein